MYSDDDQYDDPAGADEVVDTSLGEDVPEESFDDGSDLI